MCRLELPLEGIQALGDLCTYGDEAGDSRDDRERLGHRAREPRKTVRNCAKWTEATLVRIQSGARREVNCKQTEEARYEQVEDEAC